MGIGSAENPVMVEEPLGVPISGQCLCSEFGLQSVPEQPEIPCPASGWQGLVSENGYSCAGFGESRQMHTVDRDVSADKHEDLSTLELEDLSKSESGSDGDSLVEEKPIGAEECCVRSGGEEGKSEGEGGSGNLIGECNSTVEVIPVANLAGGLSLNEGIINVDACAMETSGQCLLEGKSEGESGSVNLIGECESTLEVVPMSDLTSGSSLNESIVDVDVDDCMRETAGECLQESVVSLAGECELPLEVMPMTGLANGHLLDDNHGSTEGRNLLESRLPGEDGVGNSDRDSELPLDVSPAARLVVGDCLSESKGDDACTTEKAGGCLFESGTQCEDGDGIQTGNHVVPLEDIRVPSLASGGCLNENHTDNDVCLTEKTAECLAEMKAQVRDDVGNLIGDHESPLEVTTVVSLACGDCELPQEVIPVSILASEGYPNVNERELDDCTVEKAGLPLENTKPEDDGDAEHPTGGRGLMLEITTVVELSVGECLNENPSDQERSMECLASQSRSEGEQDPGNESRDCELPLEETVVPGGCRSNKNHSDTYSRATEICGEILAVGHCLSENLRDADAFTMERRVECLDESTSKGEGGLENLTEDCEFPLKLEVADCDGQKDDESIGCFLAEDVKEEAVENKDDSVADVSYDFCDQEPIQNCESLESIPSNGVVGDTHLKKEQDFVSVDGPSLGNVSAESVASEAGTCNEISPSKPGEEASNCNLRNDQNNCSCCPTNEIIVEAVKVEGNVDTSGQSLAAGLDGVFMSETPSICVTEYEENKASVHIPSTNGVTESTEEENIAVGDVKIEVGESVLPLEENPCTGKSESQPLGDTGGGSSERLTFLDGYGSQDPIESTIPVYCFGQRGNQGKDNDGTNCVSVEKCCEIVSSSFQKVDRRSRSKSNRKTRTKKTTRKSKKTAKALSPRQGIEIFFKSGKKRSMSQSARLSDWGLLENVTQLFVQSNGLIDVIPVSNKRSRKTKGDKKSGKKNKKGAAAREQGSKKTIATANTKIRLTVKMGKGFDQSAVNAVVPELGGKGEVSAHIKCLSSDQDSISYPDTYLQVSQLINDSSRNLVTEKSSEDSRDDCFGVASKIVEASRTESRSNDPGTSPDSEVINMIPDGHIDTRPLDDIHCLVASPKDLVAPGDLTSNNKTGKSNSKPSGLGGNKSKSPQAARKSRAKPLKQYGRKQKCQNGVDVDENLDSLARANISNSSSDKEPSIVEPSLVSNEFAVGPPAEALKGESGVEINCDLVTGAGLSKSEKFKKSRSAAKTKDPKPPKGKLQRSDSGTKKAKACNEGDSQQRSIDKKKIDQKSIDDKLACKVENQLEAENNAVYDNGKTNAVDSIAPAQVANLDLLPSAVGEQYIHPRNAWVRCDDCHKWRRIAAELADLIEETQCTWSCKDNKDEAFADCSIPQEKSNSDINAELEISDGSGEEDAFGNRSNKKFESTPPIEKQETVTCATIRTNQFLHRNRRTQIIDEIMVCHCKAPSDGRLGCGNDCLNRVLNIECVPGACPCGELCSNQQFQKRKYAKLEKFHSGKKGYGLKLREDIPKGKFLIEYVGEVLDMHAYEARQKEYALKGHKHFYFMTLNGSEVIDACVKGNKGRYINHSCDPNCQTEKWMVNGEICIGLFALRDIKKGEEVTFDYNYVRVFGAAAKKCYCMSQQCRGYIGGDPLSGDVIIQSDSDEDYPKPRRRPTQDNAIRRARSSGDVIKQAAESIIPNIDERDKVPLAIGQLETSVSTTQDVQGSNEQVSPSAIPSEIFQQKEDIIPNKPMPTVHQESSSTVESPVKSSSDNVNADKSDKFDDRKHSSKARSKVKAYRSPSSVKKANVMSNAQDPSKSQLAADKLQVPPSLQPKKVIEGSFGSRFEAVEEKLNVLLEPDGGINRRKESAKGYLKLLLLTSASGGTASSESIQRNRDLSMILDALLKTRSRVVLVDIINKNGLRMLHKIMKQYRGDFKKIPILRKLLKVLEYLAVKGILTIDHIKECPPHPGMESFRESILSLTEHDDKQVHQIARNFRDRWIPRNLRTSGFPDRDGFRTEFPWSRNSRHSPMRNHGYDHFGRPSEETRSDRGGRSDYGGRYVEATRSDHGGRSAETTRSDHRGRSSESTRSDHGGRSSEATRSDHRARHSEATRFDHARRPLEATRSDHSGTHSETAAETRIDAVRIENHVSASCVSVTLASGTRTRKRKSRWDQPAKSITDSSPPKEQKVEHKQQTESNPSPAIHEMPVNCTGLDKADMSHDGQMDALEDFPPGFSSPVKPYSDSLLAPTNTILHSKCPSDIASGHPPKKFVSRLPVSYGIPLSIMQQFGTPHNGDPGSWVIAPGMPFQPFPPLPPFPRDKKHPPPSDRPSHALADQPADEPVPGSYPPAATNLNDCAPSTTGDQQPSGQIPSTEDSFPCKRGRESSYDLGTRYFKQQKWNHTKLQSPWHWTKNGWGCVQNFGGETNSNSNNVVLGNVTNDVRSTSCSEDLSYQHQEPNTQH